MNNYFSKVWPPADPQTAPLTGTPPMGSKSKPHWHLCTLMVRLWDIAVVSLLGAAVIVLICYPTAVVYISWPETPLGLGIGFGLCAITLVLHHRCAQRTKAADQP